MCVGVVIRFFGPRLNLNYGGFRIRGAFLGSFVVREFYYSGGAPKPPHDQAPPFAKACPSRHGCRTPMMTWTTACSQCQASHALNPVNPLNPKP